MKTAVWCITLLFGVSLAHADNNMAQKQSLYESLGGMSAIKAVVDDFVGRAATDPKISHFFAKTAKSKQRLAAFKNNLVNQICEAAGGPCKYTGMDMKTAHAHMKIKDADFNALVGDLVATLDKFKVKEQDKKTLLGVLGPMRKDIVTVHRSTASVK